MYSFFLGLPLYMDIQLGRTLNRSQKILADLQNLSDLQIAKTHPGSTIPSSSPIFTMFMAASNPALRSTLHTFRRSLVTKMAAAKPNKPSIPSSPFQLPKLKPLSQRILLRSPVELSCCVDSLMPYHTATSSALLNSLISVSRNSCWLPEGLDKTT